MISVNAGVSQKERHFQAIIKYLRLYLPFGCMHVKLKLIPNPLKILNFSNAQEHINFQKMQNKSMYKYSKRKKGIGHTSVH